ncbi:MAG: radical SAM protein [Candidatus ainarchaeum sp.]|nr:radical SAM protein [Candidatus ainarchaeum sp.]
MKILFMIPIQRAYVIMPPLGLGYLASLSIKKGHDARLLHCVLEKMTFEKFSEFISKNDFDLIGIQMNTIDVNSVKKHIEIIKKLKPKTIIVAGGSHPSCDPIGTMAEFKNLDFAFHAEAEIGFAKFLDWLKKNNAGKKNLAGLKKIPGLIWRDSKKIVANPPAFVDDLSSLDFPAWSLMDPRSYPEAPHGAFAKNFPTAPMVITRGCPFQCTFCAGKRITGLKVRKRSIKNAIEEIEFLKKNYGVKEIMIEDENFTLHRHLVEEFCSSLIQKNLGISWSLPSGVRLDTLDADLLKLMEKSGCYSVAVGIEFGSQRILNLTKKQLTIEKIKEKMGLFKKTNIKVTGFFMIGYPGETIEEINSTIKLALELPLQRAQFNGFMPLPGSEIYNTLVSEKKLGKLDTDRFFVHDVAFVSEGITRQQLQNLRRKAYLLFYMRPKIIAHLFEEIKSPRHLGLLLTRFFDSLK